VQKGNVFCRAAGDRGRVCRRAEGTGRNQSGFSLLNFQPIFGDNAAPDASGSKVENKAKATFFSTADFFATAFCGSGFGYLRSLAARLKALGLFVAETCSASLRRSGSRNVRGFG
jgi:hypothetical protein